MSSNPVLLATPQEWNTLSSGDLPTEYLRNKGLNVITAFSYDNALEIVQSQELLAVVMISDWAMKQESGSPGLMEFLRNKIPTFSLITKDTQKKHGYQWFDELYNRPQHEYQSMPADINAIVIWLNQIVQKL